LTTAIRGNNPTFSLRQGGRGGDSGEVPEGDYLVPFGKAAVAHEGQDVTICAIGTMVRWRSRPRAIWRSLAFRRR
jgi:pyruvate dehydrogenase E1 component beta subunit